MSPFANGIAADWATWYNRGVKKGGKATIRILANLHASQKASREMSGGVLRYAATHPGVEAMLYGLGAARENMEEFRDWKPDGVIVSTEDADAIRLIERLGCRAAVLVNVKPPARTTLRCGSIFCDGAAIAEAAVSLFVRKRLRHTAYVGTRENDPWSVERGIAMRECALQADCTFDAFTFPDGARSDLASEMDALSKWVAKLPKPCGIFAANDLRAKDVVDACAAASVSIPQQIMVLGVDDEEFICRQTQPTLSSVVPDFENGGYLAAEMLVGLLKGRKSNTERRIFGVRGVVERLSTSDPNEAGRMVGRAQEFLRENAISADITVGDVAKASFASLRLLQKNYKAITGTTVCAAIQTARLNHVCSLLVETSTPIGRIAELCGFGSSAYLKKLFRNHFGCSMRDWRRNQRPLGL